MILDSFLLFRRHHSKWTFVVECDIQHSDGKHKSKFLRIPHTQYIDGLVQDCSNSSALAMELQQSCTMPSMSPSREDHRVAGVKRVCFIPKPGVLVFTTEQMPVQVSYLQKHYTGLPVCVCGISWCATNLNGVSGTWVMMVFLKTLWHENNL